mmetsp:Transcript_27241/g.55087  ORF Transcript_27241/g.55087 Transcript_27241/m.55087 type:complete len:603 (-) Transcript_27241:75-1883(-)
MRKFERLRHIRYFSTSLRNLPSAYSSADTNRLTLVHFCVQALDILGVLPCDDDDGNDNDNGDGKDDREAAAEAYVDREGIIDWIYGLQTLPTLTTTSNAIGKDGDGCDEDFTTRCHFVGGGFKGGTYLGPLPSRTANNNATNNANNQATKNATNRHPYDHSHLAMTYVAICTLAALGDDLSRIDKTAILDTLRSLQKEDGSFRAVSPVGATKGVKRGVWMGGVGCDELEDCCGGRNICHSQGDRMENEVEVDEIEEDDDCDLRFMYTAIVIWYLLTDPDEQNDDNSKGNGHDRCNGKDDGNTQNNNNCEVASNKCNKSKKTCNQKKRDEIINIQTATSYILKCITHEGSLGLTPGREGHGGSTFCGIASLHLLGVLDDLLASSEGYEIDHDVTASPQTRREDESKKWDFNLDLKGWKKDLIRWCVMRQYSLPSNRNEFDNNGYHPSTPAGMQGRPNKLEDTCYSYWIGGTLHLLSSSRLLDGWALREYVLKCQSPYGGFGKVVGAMPDLLHSFYSLAWLAISGEGGCCDDDDDNDDCIVECDNEDAGSDEKKKENDKGDVCECDDIRKQVVESIHQFSKLDCALGMCVKRRKIIRRAFRDKC